MKASDIIIAGAGISGLLLASKLSEKFSVIVLEKEDEKPPQKYWLISNSCLKENEFLKDSVDNYYNHMDFISHDLISYRLKGDYILLDSNKLFNILKNKIKANNGKIHYSYRFYSYFIRNSQIHILANSEIYSTKILVDCMGYASPLILSKGVMQIIGYHMLYGATLILKKEFSPICLANIMINKNPVYFEAFPKSDGTAYTSVIRPISQITSLEDLKKEFDFIIEKSMYSLYFENSANENKLGGIVPIGKMKVKALDRVVFFGESAQMNPSASGTCMTMLLKNYKIISDFIEERIKSNKLSKRNLESRPSLGNAFSQKFQMYLFQEMLNWSSDDFAKFLDLLNHIDHASINKFLFNEIDCSSFIRKKSLTSVLKSGNFMWVKPLIKTVIN